MNKQEFNHFLNLPKDKQNKIINSAMMVFSKYDYKKASVNDIAKAADISKAMIFHYFGSKKQLYLFLLESSINNFMNIVEKGLSKNESDFFERIKQSSIIKLKLSKQHPYSMGFFTKAYTETDVDVTKEVKQIFVLQKKFGAEFVLNEIDKQKFKEGVSPELVLKILMRFLEGYINSLANFEKDLDLVINEFYQCVDLMKNNFYKKEFLKGE